MLEKKSSASLPAAVCLTKANLYPYGMTLGKRIRTARLAVRPKLTQAAIAKRLDTTPQAVSGWERDEAAPTPDKFPLLAELLRVDLEYLHGNGVDGTKQPQSRVVNNVGKVTNADPPHISTPIIPGSQLVGERDLPVFATSQGGKGAIVLSSDPVDWVARPEPLARVRDGYGVMVTGESMFPALEPGDIVHVHPHRPPRDGSTCIFQAHQADGTVLSSIKYLRRQTADTWYVKEWNSDGKLTPREFTMKKSEWQICHVMVGKYSRS
ncbi:MAG TPA: LexA family transcriptional regulator [Bryobacteraceae bacterium]|nr:LexA family transcriptional regulator [Bryobacteraceae bacterium]